MVQSEVDSLGTDRKALGMTHERQVGVDQLGVSLEALEHVGDVDGKRATPTHHATALCFNLTPLSSIFDGSH